MEENINNNRRAFPRFQIHQLIELSAGREEFFNATGMNISLGGLLCETDEPVDPGSSVFLLLTLPQEDGSSYELKTEGIVMHSTLLDDGGCKLGIHFTDTSSTDLEKIEAYIITSGDGEIDPRSE